MPTLHLEVCAGFANRVRAMVSGICLAEKLDIQLVIHWYGRSPECVCSFQSVIDPESIPKTCKVSPSLLSHSQEVMSKEVCQRILYHWDKKSDLYWKSCEIFYENDAWEIPLRNLKPSRKVKELLDRRCSSVDWSNAIGIHVRRTDNLKSILGSPLENFRKKMRDHKDSMFVIATDDAGVKSQLITEFGDHCIFPAVVLSRHSEEGMIHGVTDFFALSKCSWILGSFHSSFSKMASLYGNTTLEIA